MYLTNLYNHAHPLIRYELTDQIELLDDFFTDRTVGVHPHLFRSPLARRREVEEYRRERRGPVPRQRGRARPPRAQAYAEFGYRFADDPLVPRLAAEIVQEAPASPESGILAGARSPLAWRA